MPRSRLFFAAPIILAVVIIAVFAIRSRGDNKANVDTTPTKNCPPIARADAVATKPGTPISIDVLANDTDPDGDPLVFQIRNTTGGEATIDDGGTPTDASDDRIRFTPADTPPPEATIDYQALDPAGAISESTVTVEINADGVLPAGMASEAVPTNSKSSVNGCGTGRVASGRTSGTTTSTELSTSEPTIPPVSDNFSGTFTTTKNSSGRTTTTRPGSTNTTRTTDTTEPHPPTTEHTTTTATTTPPTTGTTQPDNCGPYPTDGTQEQKDAWTQCHVNQGH